MAVKERGQHDFECRSLLSHLFFGGVISISCSFCSNGSKWLIQLSSPITILAWMSGSSLIVFNHSSQANTRTSICSFVKKCLTHVDETRRICKWSFRIYLRLVLECSLVVLDSGARRFDFHEWSYSCCWHSPQSKRFLAGCCVERVWLTRVLYGTLYAIVWFDNQNNSSHHIFVVTKKPPMR